MGIAAAILGLGVLSCKKESKTESPPSAKIERSDDRDSALERFRDSLARSTSRRPMTDEEIRALPAIAAQVNKKLARTHLAKTDSFNRGVNRAKQLT